MPARKKSGGGFWRGLLLFLLGLTAGMAGAAAVSVYVNGLHLPFIEPPTREAVVVGKAEEREREALKFREVLRRQRPQPLQREEEETPAPPPRALVYYLQVAAFRRGETAEELRGQLALSGRQAVIKSGQTADGAALYRVWVGPYEDEDEAESMRAQLALDGYAGVSLLRTAR